MACRLRLRDPTDSPSKGLLDARTLPEYLNEALRLAPVFDQPQIDVVAYGCTAAGFISGPAGDAALQQNLAKITRKNVVTTAHSMVQALQEKGIKKIALVTPYLEGVNVQLKAFLAEGGVEVLSFNSFYAQNTDELGMISSAQVAQMARQTMREDCEALFIGCSQLPTCEILPDLEREWGRPVLSSIQVTAHFALQAVQSAKGFV